MSKAMTNKRLTGLVVPVGALRGKQSIGVGEFLDLIELADLCKKMDIGLIQILPVNDTGFESSPYSALTAFALHPLYLRLSDMPEAKPYTSHMAAIKKNFDGEIRFLYEKILRAKMELLREMYGAHKKEILQRGKAGGDLSKWIDENPWVKAYAVFRQLKEVNNEKSWKEWEQYQNISIEEIENLWANADLQEEHFFWVWLQEALSVQFGKAAAELNEAGILLEGDLPILMNEDSADVWAYPQFFKQDLSAGAPPDMYSPDGQNWGFPIYDWAAQKNDGYSWWKKRLSAAEKYYSAYRIDHVLGFFRIWANRKEDYSAKLGRYVPSLPYTKEDFEKLGADDSRIRWFSKPHISTAEIDDALSGIQDEHVRNKDRKILSHELLERIDNEELWLFKPIVTGEKYLWSLDLTNEAASFLVKAWHNRMFLEYEKDHFSLTWEYLSTKAYQSLNDDEKNQLAALITLKSTHSENIWEEEGRKLLQTLTFSSSMLPCAEDLGAVPSCVPKVLTELKILGLRVVRWFRDWDKDGQPYVPFCDYPELSVCTPAVHDSSCVREWWEREADQAAFSKFVGKDLPAVYNPETAKVVLGKVAGAASRFRVFQIQDLLHLSKKWYADDAAAERINVPGQTNAFNWTYRIPASLEEISHDDDFIAAVKLLAKIKPEQRGDE
ncbi:MAG: 4-alpha-glucanotransferase [Treponema sp.]|nr:4-alpha-glucanotransferase [Treponema sp.]